MTYAFPCAIIVVMKSCSITALRADAYSIVGEVTSSDEEVLLTLKGKVVAKVVPMDDVGTVKPAFAAEVKRRMKEDTLIPASRVLKKKW